MSSKDYDWMNSFKWLINEYMEEHAKFVEAHKHMPEPKYKRYDKVAFKWSDTEEFEGYVYIIDAYGTFEQNGEASYDIYSPEKNILYKHIRQSLVTKFIEHASDEKIKELENSI